MKAGSMQYLSECSLKSEMSTVQGFERCHSRISFWQQMPPFLPQILLVGKIRVIISLDFIHCLAFEKSDCGEYLLLPVITEHSAALSENIGLHFELPPFHSSKIYSFCTGGYFKFSLKSFMMQHRKWNNRYVLAIILLSNLLMFIKLLRKTNRELLQGLLILSIIFSSTFSRQCRLSWYAQLLYACTNSSFHWENHHSVLELFSTQLHLRI